MEIDGQALLEASATNRDAVSPSLNRQKITGLWSCLEHLKRYLSINSRLWTHVEVLTLTENMRITSSVPDSAEHVALADFSKWILDVGEGNVPSFCKEGETEPSWITIPPDLLLTATEDKMACMAIAIYEGLETHYHDADYLSKRAILTPTNELADDINAHIVSIIPEEEKEYLSSDTIDKATAHQEAYDLLYPVEFLNSLNGNNFPQHQLVLKKGVPVMLLRNLNQAEGLCNGTRLIITSLGDMIIEGRIITGSHSGNHVLIPRISLTLKTNKWPFILRRRQYPIKVCYAMTINKSQGQTLSAVGVYLKKPVFTHGQIYVVVSRVTNKKGLKIILEDEKGNSTDTTRNVVYREVLAAIPAAETG